MEGLIFTGIGIWAVALHWAVNETRKPEVWEPLPAIPAEDTTLRARLEAR